MVLINNVYFLAETFETKINIIVSLEFFFFVVYFP